MKISTFVLLGIVLGGVVFWKFQTQVSKFLKNMTPGASNTQGNMRGWATKNIPTIILIVVGVVLLWWSHDTKVTQLGNWGKNQPLFLLVLWGFLAALIKLHTGALGKAAEVLQWVVAGGVLLALFLGSPVGEWFTKDESTGSTAHKATVGARQVLTMAPGSESERVPTRPGHRIDFSGEGFSVYNVYRDGTVCSEGCKNGPLREVYVKNLKNEQNSVSYEFVRP